jgi:hypothetical protein
MVVGLWRYLGMKRLHGLIECLWSLDYHHVGGASFFNLDTGHFSNMSSRGHATSSTDKAELFTSNSSQGSGLTKVIYNNYVGSEYSIELSREGEKQSLSGMSLEG